MRHGEAENNVQRIASSLPEAKGYSLTARGREQIAEVAEYLSSVDADMIFSSPIRRTRETAEIISEKTKVPIVFDERLCEAGFGSFNGRSIDLFFEKYSDPLMRISPDSKDGVESYIDMRGRLQNFLNDMKEEYAGKKAVIVSHGDTLEQLHGILTDEAPGRSAIGWYPKKGSCTEVVWRM